jgi:peptide/bleomycin uptake transporter
MIRAFFQNQRWASWAYGVGALILALTYWQVQMSVVVNGWYGRFYDMLQNPAGRDVKDFWDGIFGLQFDTGYFLGFIPVPTPMGFLAIAIPYVIIGTATNFLVRHYGFRWRQAITEDYIPRWRNVEHEIEGASQRIQEDANRFARIVESLGIQIFRAIMTLIAFIPILWTMSSQVDLPVIRDIPGALVWVALLVTVGGMVISWFVGWFLPGLEYNNQKVEAAFRKELVLGEDDKVNHAKPENLFDLFTGLRTNYFRLYAHYGYFDLWSILYSQVTMLTPLIMMGPGMMAGAVTFGTFQQVSNAYGRVDASFSIILDNWTTLTELRSIWKRLHEFEVNLDKFNIGHDVADVTSSPLPT